MIDIILFLFGWLYPIEKEEPTEWELICIELVRDYQGNSNAYRILECDKYHIKIDHRDYINNY